MELTSEFLDDLSAQAKQNSRLRMNRDLRNSANDQSQRMLNALELGIRVQNKLLLSDKSSDKLINHLYRPL